jgi:CMP/dCMP kinase
MKSQGSKIKKIMTDLFANIKLITIDGPAGSGKSAVCRYIAAKTGWAYISTGLLYRAIAYVQIHKLLFPDATHWGVVQDHDMVLQHNTQSNVAIGDIVADLYFTDSNFGFALLETMRWDIKTQIMYLDGVDIRPFLDSNIVAKWSSLLSAKSIVRDNLLHAQREVILKHAPIIVDGRDMGTIVCPDAPLKIFLDATQEIRAQRRYLDLLAQDVGIKFENVLETVKIRDYSDRNREIAPLAPAVDSVMLDSSSVSIEFIGNAILELADYRNLL